MIIKNLFKKIVSLILCLLIFAFCSLNFSGCQSSLPKRHKEAVIEIQTQDYDLVYDDENSYNTCYYSLYSNKKLKETEPFVADKTEVFTASTDCFSSYIDKRKNKVLNHLIHTELTDEDGNKVKITPIISSIFEETAKLEHDIMLMEIIKDNEEYFVFVSLDVSFWTPCTLYYYNQNSSKLIELCTFDHEIVTGIKINNLNTQNNKKQPSGCFLFNNNMKTFHNFKCLFIQALVI